VPRTEPNPTDDELLAIRCQLGEPDAFDDLITRWQAPLWSFVRRPPPLSLADDLRRLTASELSWPARLGYVALLLAASTMTVIVSALLLTEPSLPLRASIALGVMSLSA
jgi:hypothetical protein